MTGLKVVADNSFTEKHAYHLSQIQLATIEAIEIKYRAGQAEHGAGGPLWAMPTIKVTENAIAESIDQISYLMTMRGQIKIIYELARLGMEDEDLCATTARDSCKKIFEMMGGTTK